MPSTKAEGYYRRALTITEKLAPRSLLVANILDNLAKTADMRNDPAMAEDYRKRSVVIRHGEIRGRMNRAYYHVKSEGLAGFRCQVVPDWDALLNNLKPDPTGVELLGYLRQTHFEVSVGPDGASSVSRQSEVAPPNEQIAARLRAASAAIEQVLTGYFQMATMFVGPLFSDGDESAKVEDLNGQYRISQKQGENEALISMDRDLMITEVKVSMSGTEVTLVPKFSKSPKGYIATGFDGKFSTAAGNAEVVVEIENQEVEGFALPKTVTAIAQGKVRIPLSFTNYEIKKHN